MSQAKAVCCDACGGFDLLSNCVIFRDELDAPVYVCTECQEDCDVGTPAHHSSELQESDLVFMGVREASWLLS